MDKRTKKMYDGIKIIPSHIIKERIEEIERIRVASAINTIFDILVEKKLTTEKNLVKLLNTHIKIILTANDQLFKEGVHPIQNTKKGDVGRQSYIG